MRYRLVVHGRIEHRAQDRVGGADRGLRQPAVFQLNLPRVDVGRPELVERPSAGPATIMCARAIVLYRFFVVAFRSDASRAELIHSLVNPPRVILRSLAGRLARRRSLTSAALSRASLAVLP